MDPARFERSEAANTPRLSPKPALGGEEIPRVSDSGHPELGADRTLILRRDAPLDIGADTGTPSRRLALPGARPSKR